MALFFNKSASVSPEKQVILLYDGTCRFCEASSRQALRFVPKSAARREDINDPALQARYNVSPQAAQREMHLVATTGKVTHGAEAVRQLFKLSSWLWPLTLLWHVPGFGWLAQKIYLWIADHRYLFMGKVQRKEIANGTGCDGESCSLHLGLKPSLNQTEEPQKPIDFKPY
jgi:predicted DCC family thiol-disulfide oxidoreductase YuxK